MSTMSDGMNNRVAIPGTPTKAPTKRLVIEVPVDLHKEIKIQAAREGKHIREIVTNLVKNYIHSQQTGNVTDPPRPNHSVDQESIIQPDRSCTT